VRREGSTEVARLFCPKIYARKINMPEFYMIIAGKDFSRFFFFWGGGATATAYVREGINLPHGHLKTLAALPLPLACCCVAVILPSHTVTVSVVTLCFTHSSMNALANMLSYIGLPLTTCVRCHVRTTASETEALVLPVRKFGIICLMACELLTS